MSLISVQDLKVHFPIRGGFFNTIVDKVYAVDGVSLEIEEGKVYGLIGESGSGKSTIGRAIIGLEEATGGKIIYKGHDVTKKNIRKKVRYNADVQMIFQDSMSSLDPKKRIRDIIGEPIINFENISPEEVEKRVFELLDIVGMPSDAIYKYPHEFSGGQRQRIGVARAVACKPKLIIADEPVSALDLSVQAQVLNYMKDIQKEFGLSYLFISHDLGVVRHMCDHIYIMHRGRFVETGSRDDIYKNPQHIYTKRLIAAIPNIDTDDREFAKDRRVRVEKEFEDNVNFYYGENMRPYDLVKKSDTHYVSIKEAK